MVRFLIIIEIISESVMFLLAITTVRQVVTVKAS